MKDLSLMTSPQYRGKFAIVSHINSVTVELFFFQIYECEEEERCC